MLYPEDWREYQWEAHSEAAGAGAVTRPYERMWRVTVTAGGVGATLQIGPNSITVLANATLVLEPKGMFPYLVTYAGVASLVVETIRRL